MIAAIVSTTAQESTTASTDADARRIQLAPDLRLGVWATEPQVLNPVAFSLAPAAAASGSRPRVAAFVAETHRYGVSVLDITQNTPWLLNDLSFRTTEHREDFLQEQFATRRVLLTRDSERVRLIADRDGDHRADESSVFAEGFDSPLDGTAAGVLAQGSDVWFANIPRLYRWSGAADSRAEPSRPAASRESRETLASGFGVHIGVTGHDLHGLVLGPDGRLYLSFGDRGLHVVTREGKTIDLPDTGGVLRCEPDGKNLEVYCTGLRNPQELAFDDVGNLFTVDNDTAGADGCRVLHLVRGADYGWRASYQHMKGFGPWVLEDLWRAGSDGILPSAGQVSQGPAGLTYYPGTGFGDRFRGKFLHCDFPGGVWAFDVEPDGAGFRVRTKEKIAWNCWPTDVDFGPDGGLYILDWVTGWNLPKKGRIYRITTTPGQEDPVSEEVLRLLARDRVSDSGETLLRELAHADRRVRMAAQRELVRRGRASVDGLRRVAFRTSATVPRLHALWGIGEIARGISAGSSQGDLSEPLASLIRLLDDSDDTVRGVAAAVLGECGLINADQPIAALTQDPSPFVRLRALEAMRDLFDGGRGVLSTDQKLVLWLEEKLPSVGRVVSRHINPSITFHPNGPVVLDLVRSNAPPDPVLRFAAASHWARLERAEEGWASYRRLTRFLSERIVDPSLEVRRTALLALKELRAPEIERFFADPDPDLVLAAVRAIHDVPIPEAIPALASLLPRLAAIPTTQPVAPAPAIRSPSEQMGRRILNAHFRLGQPTNAAALVSFALDPNAAIPAPVSTRLRTEALFLLGAWEVPVAEPGKIRVFPKADPNHGAIPTVNPENWPGWFDRVCGLWRPLPPRDATFGRQALAPVVGRLLRDPAPEVAEAALEAAVRLDLKSCVPDLLAIAGPPTAASIRRRIPMALAGWNVPETTEVVRRYLDDADPMLRASALPYLDRLPSAVVIPILARLLEAASRASDPGELRSGQAAAAALGSLRPSPEAIELLVRELEKLNAGSGRPELELDLLDAASTVTNAAVATALARRARGLPASDPLAGWREVLVGGDPTRGREVFFERPETQCSRCHVVSGNGGTVGPPLDGLASRLDRRQILDSILHPNATISPGYESVLLVLRDGRELSGVVRNERADRLTLASLESGEIEVGAGEILERRKSLSVMPEGLGELITRRQARDLIEFLAGLR